MPCFRRELRSLRSLPSLQCKLASRSRAFRSKRHAAGTSPAHKWRSFQNFTFYWCRKELENFKFRKNSNLSLIRCINFARLSSRFSSAVFLCFSGIRSNKPGRRQSGNSMLCVNTLSVGEKFIYIKKVRILAKLYFCSLYDKNYVNVD